MEDDSEFSENQSRGSVGTEIVFDTDQSLKSFLEGLTLEQRKGGVEADEVIIEMGDGKISDVTKGLLLEASQRLSSIKSLVLDMFACDCSDSLVADLITWYTTKSEENEANLDNTGRKIVKIRADFSETKFSTAGFNSFTRAIELNQGTLRHIELSLARCNISENSLPQIPTKLQDLTYLRFDLEESIVYVPIIS